MPFTVLETMAQGHLAVPVVSSLAGKKEDVVTILTPRDVFNMLHLEPRLLGEVWHMPLPGQEKGAKFPTSRAPISVGFHSFRLILGRVIISWNGLEA